MDIPTNDEEIIIINRLSERIEKYNDPEAMNILGYCFQKGLHGLPVDISKAVELFERGSELGSASAHCSLGISYQRGEGVKIDKKKLVGTETDRKKAVHHWQIAAMMGNISARHKLGFIELKNGNYQLAMKHCIIAAKCGYKDSLDVVKEGFRQGHVTKEDFEKTLRDYQASCDEAKSEQRDKAVRARATWAAGSKFLLRN